jgi:hypothetical protein
LDILHITNKIENAINIDQPSSRHENKYITWASALELSNWKAWMACLGTEGFEIASTRQVLELVTDSLAGGDRTDSSLPWDEPSSWELPDER